MKNNAEKSQEKSYPSAEEDKSISDESNPSPSGMQERSPSELISMVEKDIPEKYKPYVKASLIEFNKEKEGYLEWVSSDETDKWTLPEITLAVPLDESENPDTAQQVEW